MRSNSVKKITPVKDLSCGKYKLGVLIRDSVSGIGTVTYIEKGSRRFGSLGHAVSDERGEKLALQKVRSTRAVSSTSFAESGAEREN